MSELNYEFLKKIIPRFRKWLETEQGRDWAKDRENKDIFFQTNFARKKIKNIDEGVLRDLIYILWSFGGWTNKDWLLEQMLESGLPKIGEAFRDLLYSDKPLATRFDKMREIKMMGAASISEILAHHDHMKYPIWNRRAKDGLIKLGIAQNLLPKSSQIRGSQYEDFCNLVQTTFEGISKVYPEMTDLLRLDFLLYYVSTIYEEKPSELVEKFDHDATVDQILQLGDGLGFEVRKEFPVTKGCRIDAIWRSRIANLGAVAYAFEVHKSGSRDSVILNLQRCKADPTIQKVVIVSTEKELEIFEAEISSLPEDFRNSVGYFRVKDLQRALEQQESLKEILTSIGLLRTRISI